MRASLPSIRALNPKSQSPSLRRSPRLSLPYGLCLIMMLLARQSYLAQETRPPCPMTPQGEQDMIVEPPECPKGNSPCGAVCSVRTIPCTHLGRSSWYQEYYRSSPCTCIPRPRSNESALAELKRGAQNYIKTHSAELRTAMKACKGGIASSDSQDAYGLIDRAELVPNDRWNYVCTQYHEGAVLKGCQDRTTDGFTHPLGIFIRERNSLLGGAIDNYQDLVIHEGIHAIFQSRRLRLHKRPTDPEIECEHKLIEQFLIRYPVNPKYCF